MQEYTRSVVITRSVRTVCQCGEGVEIQCVSDDSIAKALGMTDLPTESVARAALGVWEEFHQCPPTTDELLELMGLNW